MNNNQKKILVYGLSESWGGVESIVMNIILHTASICQFTILLPKAECPYKKRFHKKGIEFAHIESWGANLRGFKSDLKNELLKKEYDYVWINACLMSNKTILSVTKKYSNAKIITHSHGSSFEENNLIKKWILLFLHKLNRHYYLKTIDYPCMCSIKSGEWYYGKKYLEKNNVHYVKNGIDTEKFKFNQSIRDEYRKALGIKDELALFHVGRLTAVKNQHLLLAMVPKLLESGIKVRLYIAGEGELKTSLFSYAKELNISQYVSFLGNRKDVDKLYQAADILLLPSFHEGFPLTLVEAQTSGLNCLVSEHVSKETSIVGIVSFLPIGQDSIDKWVSAILLSQHSETVDRSQYANLMRNEGFDINIVSEEFVKFIGV